MYSQVITREHAGEGRSAREQERVNALSSDKEKQHSLDGERCEGGQG